MCSQYHPLLPLVSIPVVCHLQKIGENRSWPFALGLKGVSRTGQSVISRFIGYYDFGRKEFNLQG